MSVKEKKRGVGSASAAHLPRRRDSLGRTLLIAFLLLTLVPLVGMSAANSWRWYRNSRAQVINQLISVATLKEVEVRTWFDSLSPDLELVVADPRIRSDITQLIDGEHRETLLAGWRSLLRDTLRIALVAGKKFDELFLMDTTGTVIVATNSSREGGTFQVQPFFKEGLKAPYVQSPFYSLIYDKMVVFAAVPVRDESGVTRGVLAGVTDLDTLNQIMLERAGLGQSGETYLVNSDYIMLTEPRSTESGDFPAVRTVGADQALSGVNGAELYGNYQYPPVPVVGVYRWIPELNVALLAEQSQAEASIATFQNVRITLATTVIAALITASASILVTRRIARPLGQLTFIATQAASGDLTQTAAIERDDEIGTLAAAFNTMILQLRDLIKDLERRVADRTRELETLNAIAGVVSRSLELDEILNDALDKMLQMMEIEAGGIYLLDEEIQVLTIAAQRGFSPHLVADIDRLKVGEGFSGRVAQSGQPLVASDISTDPRLTRLTAREERFRSLASAPLSSKGKVLGTLFLVTRGYREFADQDVQLLTSIGHQIGVAVENARLYEQAQKVAVVEERQRLARDLHDAVTQTLFSTSLIADVVPRLWEKDPEEGRRRLEQVRQGTRGALAEMRTLLLELRPGGLVQADLGDLLRQLGEAIAAKALATVSVEIDGECALSPDVHVALYRITQEALNNVARHARASHVTLSLRRRSGQVLLTINDDGRGFEIDSVAPGHFGLTIMRERAEAIGATFHVESQPGRGTQITVAWEEDEGQG